MKNYVLFIGLSLLLLILFVLNIVFGSVNVPFEAIFSSDPVYHDIIYNFRLPKALTAILTGAAISVAGLIMQTLFRNALAGPYVLGVSSGASLGVAFYILAGTMLPSILIDSGWGLVTSAIIGSVTVLLIVLSVSFRIRSSVSLLIVGIMFGQIAGSIVTILQNASNPDSLKVFIVWTFGSLSAVSWQFMAVMFPIVLIGIIICFSIQKPLNALMLGENYARGIGMNIIRTRIVIIFAVSLLAGATTAFTGPIAFIGIAVPHLVRGLYRTSDHRITIPATAICGAILLLLCDIISQLPDNGTTLPINAISALVGAPMIIWIIFKNSSKQ